MEHSASTYPQQSGWTAKYALVVSAPRRMFVRVVFLIAPLTPTAPDQQQWLTILSGIAVFEFQGIESRWTYAELRLALDDMMQAIFMIAQRTPSSSRFITSQDVSRFQRSIS
jgi:hypothetical protein